MTSNNNNKNNITQTSDVCIGDFGVNVDDHLFVESMKHFQSFN